jgi:predicted nuclease with TOPRIM domain
MGDKVQRHQVRMTAESSAMNETIECPLSLGEGTLKRTEVLDRLGVKDFARVAQLSAEEAFRLLQSRHDHEHQQVWSRFETELAKRSVEIKDRHKDELRSAQSNRDDLTRRVEACLREVAELRERNQALESELSKGARIGKREEMDFADEARSWAGIAISEKLPKNGDFILAYRAPNGDPTEPKILIDNKDKSVIAESDIDKLVRDARERSIVVAALVAREESQLRQVDRETRWSRKDGIWLLRTTRQWLARDLDLLKPIFDRMRVHGVDLLDRNTLVADELRRTFPEIDRMEKEIGKAAKAIQSVSALVSRYRDRLRELCDSVANTKVPSKSERDGSSRQTVGV